MNSEPNDPIIDAGLEEVLGGAAPPNLTANILARLAAATRGAGESTNDALPWGSHPLPPPFPGDAKRPIPIASAAFEQGAPPIQSETVSRNSSQGLRDHPRQRGNWTSIAIGLCSLAIVSGIVFVWLGNKGEQPIAQKPEGVFPGKEQAVVADPKSKRNDGPPPAENSAIAESRAPSKQVGVNESRVTVPTPTAPKSSAQVDAGKFASTQLKPPPFSETPNDAATAAQSTPNYEQPSSDAQVIAAVNRHLAEAWKSAKIATTHKATEEEWCRRVFLRLIGRIPSVQELQTFVKNGSAKKRAELVDSLLTSDTYSNEFARYWGGVWTNLLIGRTGGTNSTELARRDGLLQYLSRQIAVNRPLRELARELISAQGSNDPQADDYNGAVNFLLANLGDKATLATARTSRVFLGTQVACVQCHNHPSNEVATQQQFWELNSFFRQAHVQTEKNGFARLINVDFRGEGGKDPSRAEVYFEQRNGIMKVAYPAFPGGKTVSHSGLVAEVDRRALLADFVAKSDQLPQAFVNRLWANFLGYGFTRPVDDIGRHNPPSHPELLSDLAREFSARNTDMRAAMRWIALSDAFALSSRITKENADDKPEAGEPPLFARYYTRQLQAEEVYQSLLVASRPQAQAGQIAAISPNGAGEKARQLWLGQFARSMDTDEGDEMHQFNGSIPQSLTMMNGELMQQAISQEAGSLLHLVGTAKLSPKEKVEHLFMAALARSPRPDEMEVSLKIIGQRGPGLSSALQDIWWALLNSNEFILDH